jgi:hypothetical protein
MLRRPMVGNHSGLHWFVACLNDVLVVKVYGQFATPTLSIMAHV